MQTHKAIKMRLSKLRPHPRNYRKHPEDQINHLKQSIQEHGFYRNVVIARDGTILAGHGVVQAAGELGLQEIPVIRLEIGPEDPKALKVLTGDNEISRLCEFDDRELSQLLKDVLETDLDGLLGTGYDEKMLANLVMVTRPESEIKDFNEAAEWVGMPAYDEGQEPLKAVLSFRSSEDRAEFCRMLGLEDSDAKTLSSWWPPKEREDLASMRFEG